MITKDRWLGYISLINKGTYTIAIEHSKKRGRRVYILYPQYMHIVNSCTYQAFRKYRKYITSIPGARCNQMH